jgi:hypothetical protein
MPLTHDATLFVPPRRGHGSRHRAHRIGGPNTLSFSHGSIVTKRLKRGTQAPEGANVDLCALGCWGLIGEPEITDRATVATSHRVSPISPLHMMEHTDSDSLS